MVSSLGPVGAEPISGTVAGRLMEVLLLTRWKLLEPTPIAEYRLPLLLANVGEAEEVPFIRGLILAMLLLLTACAGDGEYMST
jgi:hypothetical protein